MLANSCQSLSLQSLSSLITPTRLHWAVLGFNPGYHPGSRERKWGTPKGRHCCLWEKDFCSVFQYSGSADLGGKVEPPLPTWKTGGGRGRLLLSQHPQNIHSDVPIPCFRVPGFFQQGPNFCATDLLWLACKHLQRLCLQPAVSLSAPPLLERRAPLQVTTEAPKLCG